MTTKATPPQKLAAPQARFSQVVRALLARASEPPTGELPKPSLSPDFPEQSFHQRATETLRYTLADLEYNLSPHGCYRSFLKMCLRITIPIVTAVFLFGHALLYILTMATAIILALIYPAIFALVILLGLFLARRWCPRPVQVLFTSLKKNFAPAKK